MLPIKRSHPAGPLDEAIADIVGWTCCPFESEGKARIAVENGAEGTDHGTASVQFVVGGSVQPGLFGDYPDLGKLVDGDLVHTLDYRALYEQVCSKWLGDTQNTWGAYQDNRLTSLLKT